METLNTNKILPITKNIGKYKINEYLGQNIYVIENIIEHKFCEEIINFIDTIPLQKTVYNNGNNVECFVGDLNSLLKENDDMYYSFSTNPEKLDKQTDNIYTNKINGVTKDEIVKYNGKINEKMKIVAELMKEINNKIRLEHNTGYVLRKHYGATRTHIDGIPNIIKTNTTNNIHNKNVFKNTNMIRNTTCIFVLNDEFDGGVFSFGSSPYNISFKPKRGSIILFPPFWTHPHEVSAIDSPRYTVCSWSCETIK